MLDLERHYWASGYGCVAGVDEAGRGPLAGPVVAAAVVFAPETAEHEFRGGVLGGLTDSKQLSASRRDAFFAFLTEAPGIQWGIGQADREEIDAVNILQATYLAMARAIAALPELPPLALVDGRPVAAMPCPTEAFVKGDSRSLSIAAASVIAKVTRDRAMVEAAREFPQYGFEEHKGYGTPAHLAALQQHGPCALHRRSFRPVREALEAGDG